MCRRLVSFLHASEQYQLALPLVGLAVEWQWRMKVGEVRREVVFVACGVLFLVMLMVSVEVVEVRAVVVVEGGGC